MQIGDSLYQRGVGGEVIPRDADALDPLCEFLQKALPSQCVAASGSDQSHGEGIRLQFVVAGVGAAHSPNKTFVRNSVIAHPHSRKPSPRVSSEATNHVSG